MTARNVAHNNQIPKKGLYIWAAAVLLIIAGGAAVAIGAAQKRGGDTDPAVSLVQTYVRESAARDWPGVMPLLSGEALQSARYAQTSASNTPPEKVQNLEVRTWASYGSDLDVVEATVVSSGGIKGPSQTDWQRLYFWVLNDGSGRHIVHVSENPPALDPMSQADSVPSSLNLDVQKYLALAARGDMHKASAYLADRALTVAMKDPQYTDTKVRIPVGSVVGASITPLAKSASSEIVEASYSVTRAGMPKVSLRVLAVCVNAGGSWYISDLYLAGQTTG